MHKYDRFIPTREKLDDGSAPASLVPSTLFYGMPSNPGMNKPISGTLCLGQRVLLYGDRTRSKNNTEQRTGLYTTGRIVKNDPEPRSTLVTSTRSFSKKFAPISILDAPLLSQDVYHNPLVIDKYSDYVAIGLGYCESVGFKSSLYIYDLKRKRIKTSIECDRYVRSLATSENGTLSVEDSSLCVVHDDGVSTWKIKDQCFEDVLKVSDRQPGLEVKHACVLSREASNVYAMVASCGATNQSILLLSDTRVRRSHSEAHAINTGMFSPRCMAKLDEHFIAIGHDHGKVSIVDIRTGTSNIAVLSIGDNSTTILTLANGPCHSIMVGTGMGDGSLYMVEKYTHSIRTRHYMGAQVMNAQVMDNNKLLTSHGYATIATATGSDSTHISEPTFDASNCVIGWDSRDSGKRLSMQRISNYGSRPLYACANRSTVVASGKERIYTCENSMYNQNALSFGSEKCHAPTEPSMLLDVIR